MGRSTQTLRESHRRQAEVTLNLVHLPAHRELVTPVPVHPLGKETVLLHIDRMRISEKTWAQQSEPGPSFARTLDCSALPAL